MREVLENRKSIPNCLPSNFFSLLVTMNIDIDSTIKNTKYDVLQTFRSISFILLDFLVFFLFHSYIYTF